MKATDAQETGIGVRDCGARTGLAVALVAGLRGG
jgi:hypothetical protein